MKSGKGRAPWWELHQGRLNMELSALVEAGIEHCKDKAAMARGVLRLDLVVQVGGEPVKLVATFPELYPYFRFEVAARELDLKHHHNPIGKNLCLMGRSTHYWHTSDTLAGVLGEQLERTLSAGETDDAEAVRGVEQHQAEPFSDYYSYAPGMFLLGRDWQLPAECQSGRFRAALATPSGRYEEDFPRGLVTDVCCDAGESLGQSDEDLVHAFSDRHNCGSWLRVDRPIGQGPGVFEELLRQNPRMRSAKPYRYGKRWHQTWALVFSEEASWRDSGADGWLFVGLAGKRNELLKPRRAGANGGRRRRHKTRRQS